MGDPERKVDSRKLKVERQRKTDKTQERKDITQRTQSAAAQRAQRG
jgi:hypothetical protein